MFSYRKAIVKEQIFKTIMYPSVVAFCRNKLITYTEILKATLNFSVVIVLFSEGNL